VCNSAVWRSDPDLNGKRIGDYLYSAADTARD
jgi:hypothetical protein